MVIQASFHVNDFNCMGVDTHIQETRRVPTETRAHLV